MKPFYAKIQIIGVNPYVLLPSALLKYIFQKAGKDKGAIPVKLKISRENFYAVVGMRRRYVAEPTNNRSFINFSCTIR